MAGEHARAAGFRPFRRALTITLIVLGVFCAVFAVLGYLQGPKLSAARVDVVAVTSAPDQQLRLFANQAVAEVDPDAVTVAPAAEFTVATNADVITVQFSDRLKNATDYTVEVRDVRSPYDDRSVTFHYAFTTTSAGFYYLDRADPLTGSDDQDEIVWASATGPERVSVVRATAIQSFAVVGRVVAVATLENNLTSALTIVDPASGSTERLVLPAEGTIDLLRASESTSRIAFTFTSLGAIDGGAEYEQTLFTVDLAGDHRVVPVDGLGGAPIDVIGYSFVPESARVVVQGADLALFDIDLGGTAPPLPLGSYAGIGRVSNDGTEVVVDNVFGQFALTIADGTETRLDIAPVQGIVPYGGDIQIIGPGLARVQQVAVFDDETGRFSSHVVHQDAAGSRVLYEKTDQRGSIETFEVSPNGQYLAVTTVPDLTTSVLDGYVVEPTANTVTTLVIDISSGATLGTVEGFEVQWAPSPPPSVADGQG